MPELPDVEGYRRVVIGYAVGQPISNVEVRDCGVIRNRPCDAFVDELRGHTLMAPGRIGKWLLAHTDGPTLIIHFGMTGNLGWAPVIDTEDRFVRVVIDTPHGRLLYRDQRKLGGLWLAADAKEIEQVIGRQGPDAFGLTSSVLAARVERHRGTIKAALMDQSVVAGLGNMLSDEILWKARIQPARRAGGLDRHELRQLGRSTQQVLRPAVQAGRIPRRRTWLSSQRSSDDPRCPRCHEHLRTTTIAGRTSYWCPACQPCSSSAPAPIGTTR